MLPNRIVQEDIIRVSAASLPWRQFEGARILVTGASGFLPAYMVETLLYLNEHVLLQPCRIVALVRNAEAATARFGNSLNGGQLELLVQDVCDPIPDRYRFEYVVHAASQASPRFYHTDPVGTLSSNVFGTRNLLVHSQHEDMKGFLFFSSGDVYGTSPNKSRVLSEKDYGSVDCTDVRSCYGESKRIAETMCVAWAHQFGVPAKIVRPFHTYGPGMKLNDGRVFADFVRDILAGGPIVMQSDGAARRCFCYLADATEGFFRVLLKGAIAEAYNVANTLAECSIAELANSLAQDFGLIVERRSRTDNTYVPSPIQFTYPSTAKLEALGWKATTSIRDGFGRTVESYLNPVSAEYSIRNPE